MKFLSPSQIEQVLEIVDRYTLTFVAQSVGEDILTESDRELLDSYGIDIDKINPHDSGVTRAFKFGILSDALGHSAAKNYTFKQFKTSLKEGTFIPLNKHEQAMVQSLKYSTYSDIKKLGGNIKNDIANGIVEVDRNGMARAGALVRDATKEAIEKRKGVTEIASIIGKKTEQWDRDLLRIAEYNMHQAFNAGRLANVERSGPNGKVYFDVFPGSCKHCIRLYLTAGFGSEPRIFTTSMLKGNGTNIGRKAKDWKATLSPVHPYCFDKETDVLTRGGWKNWQDVTGNEEFLSVDPITAKSEWVKAVKLIKYWKKGKMQKLKGHAFDLLTTSNHHHFVRSDGAKSKFGRLIEGNNLKNDHALVNIVPNAWTGKSPETKMIGNVTIPFSTYCKFMGWWLSEGSAFKKKDKNTYVIDVSQHKEYNIKEIKELFIEIFGKHTNCSEGHIGTYVDKSIGEFFMQFGHSHEKFVPEDIKNASKEHIEMFTETFRKGDGTMRSRENDKIKSKPEITYSTSSERLASDLGELIIKMDFRPSYFYREPVPVRHHNGVYTAKRTQITICQNRSKTSIIKKMDVSMVDYDDYVYDVELEKYHTLYVRRNGKVTISGNCRCTLNEVPEGFKWDPATQTFTEPDKEFKRKVERKSKVNVTVTRDGKETKTVI